MKLTCLVVGLVTLQFSAAVLKYELVYGSVLALPIQAKVYGNKQATALFPRWNVTKESWLKSVNLYFTVDGVTPYSMAYCDHHQCYSLKALIGQLHSRLALSNETQYHDTISIDANMQPHAYGHTSFHKGDCPDACVCPSRAVATLLVLHWWVYQVNYRQTSGNLVCGLTWQDLDGANLSIATYNIWNVNSTDGQSSRVRLKRLGKLLASSDLDIITLQEVRLEVGSTIDGTVDQMKQLQKMLPDYQYIYQPAMLMSPYPRVEEGVAVFSRYPILASDYLMLPWNQSDPSDFHQRVCLHVSVLSPVGEVQVFSTHLSLGHDAQLRSVVAIWEYMSLFPGPTLLTGDFNAEPDSDAIRFLAGELSVGGVRATGLVNAWSLMQGQENDFTFSALEEPSKKIDYIWIRHDDVIPLCVSSLQLLGKHYNPPVSDHYGLAVKFMSTKR